MVPVVAEQQKSIVEHEKIWLWLIILVGAALRLYHLDSQSLWQDEGLQYFIANAENIGSVLERTQWRTWHPPLSFFINHLFLLVGSSDFFLRLPSALFGIGSLPLCYVLVKRLTSGDIALFVILVFALSPFHIWYSQEGRMYAQLLFFSLLSSVVLLQALERSQWRWWFFYAFVVAAGMLTHILMAFGVMAHLFWVLLYHRRHLLWFIAGGVVAALLFLPWAYTSPKVKNFLKPSSTPRTYTGSASSGFSWEVLPYTF
ncbi:MAG: glycosyltransferase family 39 protein, partial [Nitrososphaera sp.]|nr:glycosyltransferase family 39 protein [Nitrososphaera sp.]